jgi:dihydroorotase
MIIEGFYVDENGEKKYGQVEFNGKIKKISKKITDTPDIKIPKDGVIFPGFIDLHVHAREDSSRKWNYKEDYETAGNAAINGGVTAFMDMPNTPVPAVDLLSLNSKKKLCEKSKAHVYLYAGIGDNTNPTKRHKYYKVFMTKSIGDLYFKDYDSLEKQIRKYKEYVISFHCEDAEIIERDSSRPEGAEIKAIENVIELTRKYNLRANICHVSTKEGLKLIDKAKKEKLKITCEATPHHLFFDNENVKDFSNSKFIKMNPPLRYKEDRLYLLEGLRSGKIDFLATDHAPHTLEEKKKDNPSGVPHLDTYGNFVTWLIKMQGFSLKRTIEICSLNPAKFLGIKQGIIKNGYNASFTVLNLNRKMKIEKSILKTKCGWSPFEGYTFPGSVVMTVVGGKCYEI